MPDRMRKLMFEDWIAASEHKQRDWVVAARRPTEDWAPGLFTISALLPNQPQELDALRGSAQRGFPVMTLGKPGFEEIDGRPVYCHDLASLRPPHTRGFTILREGRPGHPAHFELLQEFLLYHDAVYDAQESTWVGRDGDGGSEPVARRFTREAGTRQEVGGIEVATPALQDYLAAAGCVLVRYHDHSHDEPAAGLAFGTEGEEKIERATVDDVDRHYDISAAVLGPYDVARGHLLGYDLVQPHTRPRRGRDIFNGTAREYECFVIGVGEDGREVLSTCEYAVVTAPDRPGPANTFTQVCFPIEVLERYQSDPERYSIEQRVIRGPGWYLTYDRNSDDLVAVWLKDLGLIPVHEQRHWRAHNVPPRGRMSPERWQQDIEGRFLAEPAELADKLRVAYRDVNEATRAEWGFEVFKPLRGADAGTAASIASPIPDRAPALDRQVIALAKLLCESIAKDAVTKATGLLINEKEGPIRGRNQLLDAALRASGVPDTQVDAAMGPLHALQRLRAGAVHPRGGTEWDRARRNAGITGLRPKRAWEKVLGDVVEGLCVLRDSVRPLKCVEDGQPSQ